MRKQYWGLCLLAILLMTCASAGPLLRQTQTITAEGLVAKHLDSIGSAEARTAIRSRVISGTAATTVRRGGSGQMTGEAIMASMDNKSAIRMSFSDVQYSNDKMGFDGKSVTVGQLRPGVRSPLGQFLFSFDVAIKEGLIGGTLSSAWPLLDLRARNPKLRYAGTKTISDRRTHVLKYLPRESSVLEVSLFFDAETFQHVRTEYERVLNTSMASQTEVTGRRQETRNKMVEEFSDFKKEGGLMLPHAYKLQLDIDRQNRSLLQEWVLILTQFVFNESLDDRQFNVAK